MMKKRMEFLKKKKLASLRACLSAYKLAVTDKAKQSMNQDEITSQNFILFVMTKAFFKLINNAHPKVNKLLRIKVAGDALMNTLIALAIMGLIAAIAVPSFQSQFSRAYALEAQQMLEQIYSEQVTYSMVHSKYTTNLEDLYFDQPKLSTEGGKANYVIEIKEASNTGFIATATSVVDFDGDGQFNVWQVDQDKNVKEVLRD